jgi:alpha-glucosidase
MSKDGSFLPDSSWAVISHPVSTPEFKLLDKPEEIILTTARVVVHVKKHPCRISFNDKFGNVILQDEPSKGMEWSGSEVAVWKTMPSNEQYYGFGEKAGMLDRRGLAMSMWNTDIPAYPADLDPLYQDIPFFYGIRDSVAYGIFFDNTYYSHFDMGKEHPGQYSFGAMDGEMNYYFFFGPEPKQVLKNFSSLIGKMNLPPLWSIGYQQCRWSYSPESRVREIASTFRTKHIPCDVIYLDIDYMDGYRCFTWNKSRFPDPKKMTDDLARDGFKIVTIIDPGIKHDSAYWVYQEGVKGDNFVKKPDGTYFYGDVWPGECAFPDFTKKEAREWWGSLYKGIINDGIKGFWNDMNEPSVFNGPNKTMPIDVIHDDMGQKTNHSKNHNIYGMQMARGTYEGALKLKPNERPFVLTRAGYAGSNRYAAAWTGDNVSSWEHLQLALTMCLNLSISGQPFVGSDIGGFIGMPSGDLYARWLQLGVFTPLMRSHAEIASPNKEPWVYGDSFEAINRKTIEMRYKFLPYIYTSFYNTSVTGIPMMRPIVFDYSTDPYTYYNHDCFLFGDALLVAPVMEEGATKRSLRLPAGEWYDYYTAEKITGPKDITVDAPQDRLPLFVKAGSIIPTQNVVQYTNEKPTNPVIWEVYPKERASGSIYEDDGESFNYQQGKYSLRGISMQRSEDRLTFVIAPPEGSFATAERSIIIKINAVTAKPGNVSYDGDDLKEVENGTDFAGTTDKSKMWSYDINSKVVWIKIDDARREQKIVVKK